MKVPFIIHIHNARNTNEHYDLRFLDGKNKKILHSFAFPKNLDEILKSTKKSFCVKTKDHDPRWLTLKSYRLKTFDEGEVDIITASKTFFKLNFNGKQINGTYILFKLNNSSFRNDGWLLVQKKDNEKMNNTNLNEIISNKPDMTALYEGMSIRNRFNHFYSLKDFDTDLFGGISDGYIPSDFPQSELYTGTKRELVHTHRVKNAMKIAMNNLLINPDYYKNIDKWAKIDKHKIQRKKNFNP